MYFYISLLCHVNDRSSSMLWRTSCKTCTSTSCKMDAKNDKFTVDTCKKTYCFNVLKNDKGCTKVVPGTFTTAKGGKVVMKSNGVFCYTQPVSCSKMTDSFKYTAKCKSGKTDTATVELILKCSCSRGSSCSSCSSGSSCSSAPKCTSCSTCN